MPAKLILYPPQRAPRFLVLGDGETLEIGRDPVCGLVVEDPVDALARLQRARALSASGDLPRARAGYEDFLALWKQADSDAPLLKQAQAEAAKLR